MKYVYLESNTVREIIPEFDQVFPGVPITERYAPDFLDKLLCVDDDVAVEQNWVYNPATKKFSMPPSPEMLGTDEPIVEGQPTIAQLLGRQITDEQLARIELGQRQTDIELSILGGTQHV